MDNISVEIYSTPDGPRYVAGIQDAKDKTCYKDFFESEKLSEVKEVAKADNNGLEIIIFDRNLQQIIERITPEKTLAEEPKQENKPLTRRKRRKHE